MAGKGYGLPLAGVALVEYRHCSWKNLPGFL